jgi:hypothetical protein
MYFPSLAPPPQRDGLFISKSVPPIRPPTLGIEQGGPRVINFAQTPVG